MSYLRDDRQKSSMTRLQLFWGLGLVTYLVLSHNLGWIFREAITAPSYPVELIGVILVAGGLTFVGGKREDRLKNGTDVANP